MRATPKMLAFAIVALISGAIAAEPVAPEEARVIRLNSVLPGVGRTVSTDLKPTPVDVPAVPGASAPTSAPATAPVSAGALPPIAAAGPAPSVSAPAPLAGASDAASAAVLPAAGAPLKTYATLQDAANDGVDPLRELSVKPSRVLPKPVEVAEFDWRNLASMLAWGKNQWLARPLVVGGAVLLSLLALVILRRRRG